MGKRCRDISLKKTYEWQVHQKMLVALDIQETQIGGMIKYLCLPLEQLNNTLTIPKSRKYAVKPGLSYIVCGTQAPG